MMEAWLDGDSEVGRLDPLAQALDRLYGAGPGDAATLRAQRMLRRELIRDGADEPVYYDHVQDEVFGLVYLAVRRDALVAVAIGVPEEGFVRTLAARSRVTPIRSPERLRPAARQLKEYLHGGRTRFDLPVDLSGMTEFQRDVLSTVSAVPHGEVVSYGELARRIGRPNAARAVGQALSRNPIPIVIPCHRVLAADGSLRGYAGTGGVETKAKLLQLEGARV
jgi:methylated-DNA-[protein]-cysteine S-methyltransferase